MQSGRVGEAPVERGSLSEYFPSFPIMSALMGKTASESAATSAPAAGAGFKGFALVRGLRCPNMLHLHLRGDTLCAL